MDRLLYIISLLYIGTIVSCGYNDFDDYIPEAPEAVMRNADIGFIRSICGQSGVYNVTDSIIIAGYITANDKSGNIYRSFFIEDGTGSIEVRAGMYSLHNVYIRDRYVAVKLSGLTVSIYNGTLQAGLSVNESGSGTGYFDNWTVAGEYLLPSDEYSKVLPVPLTIPQLSPSYCGRLISVPGVVFTPDEDGEEGDDEELHKPEPSDGFVVYDTTWAAPRSQDNSVPQSAYRHFEDRQGNRIAVYTSGYANFAGQRVPVERVTLTGILYYSVTEGYNLRLRDTGDVKVEIN